MKLAILSDTHGFHRGMSVPDAEVLIHCGDYSRDHGSWTDTLRMADWMGKQPHKHKILCPGNHDQAISEHPTKAAALFRDHGIHMLGKTPVEIDGVVFDGGPYMPVSGWTPAWAFEMSDQDRQREWERVERCHVLVTHTPPMGILDQTSKGPRVGDPILRTQVFGKIRPRLHCFGHIHESRGLVQEEGIWFMNASSNTRGHFTRDDQAGMTHMTMGIRDAYTFDLEI